jgi:hypothetical protein
LTFKWDVRSPTEDIVPGNRSQAISQIGHQLVLIPGIHPVRRPDGSPWIRQSKQCLGISIRPTDLVLMRAEWYSNNKNPQSIMEQNIYERFREKRLAGPRIRKIYVMAKTANTCARSTYEDELDWVSRCTQGRTLNARYIHNNPKFRQWWE